MKHVWFLTLLFITSCGQQKPNESDIQESGDSLAGSEIVADTLGKGEATTDTAVSNDTTQAIKVTAYLVYENDELSSFDILNDEGIALWNTVIGEGSAERSSTQTRVIIYGYEKGIDIVIKNGEASMDMKMVDITEQLEITVPDTGCSLVEIMLSRKGKTLYQGTIPFECGE